MLTRNSGFSLSKYFEVLENNIQTILLRPENDNLTYDILDTEKSKINKLLALKEKKRQMKVGEIWQEVLGNYNEFTNLKTYYFFILSFRLTTYTMYQYCLYRNSPLCFHKIL